MQGSFLCELYDYRQRVEGAVPFGCFNHVHLLRAKGILPEYQTRRDIACTDIGRFLIHVFGAKRLF